MISKLNLAFGRTIPHNLAIALVAEANMQAKWAYTAKPYSGQITLFRATEPANFNKQYLPTIEDWQKRDRHNGWGDLADKGLKIHDVPGDHYSIFTQPHVPILAAKLRACLQGKDKG